MYRTHTCGELRQSDVGKEVTLSGWVQSVRDKGTILWADVRDRYGLTQLVVEEGASSDEVVQTAKKLGREFVVQVKGAVVERQSKNLDIQTGDIELKVSEIRILNASQTPPFTIQAETDGGEELRMQYRYLDLRREPLQKAMALRHQTGIETRKYLDSLGFFEIETPFLIKSTPEGARDFMVPSRLNPGQFYALPQSPQTFKQLLMVSGYDRYFQIVRCFRDEDLRADRQPEFTQIDCEMSFVDQEDILQTFEGLVRHLFKNCIDQELPAEFPRMTYDEAMEKYGSDKPDLRFGMEIQDLKPTTDGSGFKVFDEAEAVRAIVVPGCAEYTRKQLDALTDWVKRPQIGAKGLVHCKCNEDGSYKSSVDKFFDQDALTNWASALGAKAGDLILVLSGDKDATMKQMGELRLHMGEELGLRDPNVFKPVWVLDFPLLEWDEETQRWHAMHHPFTSPKEEDMDRLLTDPGSVKANAYDLAMNGVELGGGSIRIHSEDLQMKMFRLLGFSDDEADEQFGFLMGAFRYGAPPHGGIAFGFDRLVSTMGGSDVIRDYIAFPKNNRGQDVMISSPSDVDSKQLEELGIGLAELSR